MGKKDLTIRMAREAGITHAQAHRAFNSLLVGVRTSLKEGRKVNFSGFGSFEVKEREARKGRNPKTGDPIEIPRKRRIKFTPSRGYKNTL